MAQEMNMPMDPTAMDPNAAVPTEGAEMATPEQIESLRELMSEIETKYRQMNAESFAGGNQTEALRKDLVLDVFKMLKDVGVDLSNPESVREFLNKMEEENPDLYDLFVSSFEGLLGQGEGVAGVPAGAEEAVTGIPAPAVEEQPAPEPMGMPPMPGGPSNPGLSGMVPGGSPLPGKFPNLVK